jgi:VirE-like protein/type III restriction/modification enzyme restriction subunit
MSLINGNIPLMSIQTSYLEECSIKEPTQIAIDDVIAKIKSDQLAPLVNQIRNEQDAYTKKFLKRSLPLWFPTVQIFSSNSLTTESLPTGIIQFDVDVKDNLSADFEHIKAVICAIPETIYAFTSPSQGLKFGIKTDFTKNEDDSTNSLKQRFKQAYKQVQEHVSTFININFDNSMETIKYGCFLSHDPDAYLNLDCSILTVNDTCVYIATESSIANYDTSNVTTEFVVELLEYIPSNLDYRDRLSINFAVFNTIGKAGIDILFQHWSTGDRKKLKSDLDRDYKKANSYGDIGHLVNKAKEYGYKPELPQSRINLTAQPCDYQFPELLSPHEAKAEFTALIEQFFECKQSKFINVSTGFGKTQTTLEILRTLPVTTRVLYLVDNHKLATEIKENFLSIELDNSTFKKKKTAKSKINHIKGKTYVDGDDKMLCLRPKTITLYKDASVAMPVDECRKSCSHTYECPYLSQFSLYENIRLMTHEEFFNTESIWFNGLNDTDHDSREPRLNGGKWRPDYIIVDEDWLARHDYIEYITTKLDGIRNIINDCKNGKTLAQSIEINHDLIINDYEVMQQNNKSYVEFKNTRQYIAAKQLNNEVKRSDILTLLYDYITHGYDEDRLKKIHFDSGRNCLFSSAMTKIASRYKNTPTLYLDATAEKSVINATIGDVDFHSIRVKSHESINIYQLENYCWSKQRLKNTLLRNELIEQLKDIASRYNSVGLITYRNIPSLTNFDTWLANQLDINIVGHFSHLRGLNVFSDVDCLLVIGRQMIPQLELHNYYHALYNDANEFKQEYIDVPVRMKDGSTKSLNNKIYSDPKVQSIAKHFSLSETIQAIGRGRLIYGKPKDIYLFSNESLGADIEVTKFFRYKEKKFNCYVEKLKMIGFCRDTPRELMKLGLSEHHIKKNRDDIHNEFLKTGIENVHITYKNKYRKKVKHKYYVSDRTKLVRYLEQEKVKEIMSVQ